MRKNWIARAAGVAAVALALSAAGTGTADAAIYDCRISGDRAKCSTVTGIDPGSWLQVRTGPGYGYPNQPGWPRLYNGPRSGCGCRTAPSGVTGSRSAGRTPRTPRCP
jgi:hypothetical protein